MRRVVRNPPLQLNGPSGPNNRRYGRVRCESLACTFPSHDNQLAEVLDLSCSGMRLVAKRVVKIEAGSTHEVDLRCGEFQARLPVKVVWISRKAHRHTEMGVTFGEPTGEQRDILSQLMRAASDMFIVYTKVA